MKEVPTKLRQTERTQETVQFRGDGSRLALTELAENILEVRYDFSSFPVIAEQEDAAMLLYDENRREREARTRSGLIPAPTSDSGGRPGDVVALSWGDRRIEVTLESGTIAVYRGDTLIHGGRIGSDDTVLPRYPVRIHGTPPNHVTGAFNFPLEPADRFFGLGEKAGGVDRRGRRFLMHNRDALGYRAKFADPLYKSVPFLIKQNPETGVCLGIAFTTPDVAAVDLGVESEYYYSVAVRNGPYRYVVFIGNTYTNVLERYTFLTGRPAFPPAFTFGFLGSSMDYSEPDDAQDRITAYLDTVERLDIPCEGLYLSSGYYRSDNGRRYTFEWNTNKFPDPVAFLSLIRDRGYHIACNIKPGILNSHPRFEVFAGKGVLLNNPDGSVYTEYYWGGDAGLWNFASEAGQAEWRTNLRERLLDPGFDGTWNDNNEYEIEDSSLPAYSQRTTMALMMNRASWEEMLTKNPDHRPWIITRAGSIGVQRYARTWSGDNASTWESLYYNTVMGSSFGLSGMPFFGHDIGGFFGPRPDTEQFVRWCQSAVFQPRFVIHSWNDDAEPTELWSYTEVASELRQLVLQHYEFMPYTYSCAWNAHCTGKPIQRHPYVEFPQDPAMRSDDAMHIYGDALLVSLPLEQGRTEAEYHLPRGTNWFDPDEAVLYKGGTVLSKVVPTGGGPYLVREGAVVVRAPGARSLATGVFEELNVDLYPGPDEVEFNLFEDDGVSRTHLGRWSETMIRVEPHGFRTWLVETEATDSQSWDPGITQVITMTLPDGFVFSWGGRTAAPISREEMRTGWSATITGSYRIGDV